MTTVNDNRRAPAPARTLPCGCSLDGRTVCRDHFRYSDESRQADEESAAYRRMHGGDGW